MEANVTLHWFVHPQWFDEIGGWRNPDNIKYFVEWARLAFKHFGQSHHITQGQAAANAVTLLPQATLPAGSLLSCILCIAGIHAAFHRIVQHISLLMDRQ